eukprot:TRINITY_DN15289_c0_g1_i1.p3 TRINITY_DN15289_c0_g1~~TRINITY_DN15289_c0_g1_i1.p3  ORF type:complete len:126 (-),score=37.78 TRINITY_DN15289_c0_g1_i1:10-387(-)
MCIRDREKNMVKIFDLFNSVDISLEQYLIKFVDNELIIQLKKKGNEIWPSLTVEGLLREQLIQRREESLKRRQEGLKKFDERKTNLKHELDRYATQERMRLDDICLLYTSPSPRDRQKSRMPSSA